MKITVHKNDILAALKRTARAGVSGKGEAPILACVKISTDGDNAVKLMATNLQIAIETSAKAVVKDAGEVAVPQGILTSAIDMAPDGEIKVETVRSAVCLSAGEWVTRIRSLDAADMPVMAFDDTNAVKVELPGGTFSDMVRKVRYAASKDETRKNLKGLYFHVDAEGAEMVAADGRCLSHVSFAGAKAENTCAEALLPISTAEEIAKNGDFGTITLEIAKDKIRATADWTVVTGKLLGDVYPNWKRVVPEDRGSVCRVSRTALIASVLRAQIMLPWGAAWVKFTFKENHVEIESAKAEAGDARDVVDAEYNDEPASVTLDPNFVLAPLKASDADEVDICVKDGLHPVMVCDSSSKDRDFYSVIMPLRAN